MFEMYTFVRYCKQFRKDIYKVNDRDILDKKLIELNKLYDETVDNLDIPTMEKEYILSRFVKLSQLTMYTVPVMNNMCQDVEDKYRRYHCLE